MAIAAPKYQSYAFGNQNFAVQPGGLIPITEGTPAGAQSIFYTGIGTATTANTAWTQQLYPQGISQSQQQTANRPAFTQEQLNLFREFMRASGHTSWGWEPAEEPKALETRSLGPADREALEKELPF